MNHGTYVTYVQGKCRCADCRQANRLYERRRNRERAYASHNPDLARLVDAEPARQHMRSLMSQGMGWKRVANCAGVANGTAYVILYGKGGTDPGEHRPPRRRIRRDIADRILAVRLDLADGAHVEAVGTTRRLRALVATGWAQSLLASRLGISASNATPLFDGSRANVQLRTVRAVRDLYDELWDTPGDSTRARNDARRKGWFPPLAWDDDTIDDPASRPHPGEPVTGPHRGRNRDDVVEDYRDTWDHHLGYLPAAATRLGLSEYALEQALRRSGIPVSRNREAT